jgi:iduronate 2-sulfatase
MTRRLLIFLFAAAAMVVPAVAGRKPNILLLCIDDLRPELKCFGADYIQSPHIDKLAAAGRPFMRHYVQAPTCGASRFALLAGRYGPSDNGALLKRGSALVKNSKASPPSLPAWFRQHGYTTVSLGKVSHHPGGRGGPDWNDDSQPEMPLSWDRHLLPAGPWQHPRGAMHGLANGEIRVKAGEMDLFQSTPGPDTIYPDGLITNEALNQLDLLAKDRSQSSKPFFLAVGIIRPHLPFGAPAKYMEPYKDAKLPPIPHPDKPEGTTTWHGSGEFMKYKRWGRDPRKDDEFATEVRKHYAACVTYADAQVGRILAKLDALKLTDDTIIILWGDHGWHLGEHAIWGKHSLFEESLRSPLIIKYTGIPEPGVPATSVVESIDLFPTLCDLAGLGFPGELPGEAPILKFSEELSGGSLMLNLLLPGMFKDSGSAISYAGNRETIRTPTHRLIRHGKKGGEPFLELYDHRSDPGETDNIALAHPELTRELVGQLDARLKR